MNDQAAMAHALRLAERGLETTTPNPRVGCVIVRDGVICAEGWHERAGEPHAEVVALTRAGAAARGATLAVNLEPCAHHGRTPPCVDAIIGAGIKRVVAAMQDPNPLVAGKGLHALRAAGIDVLTGVLENEARELNIGFISRFERLRPWTRLKVAASVDGKTALNNGQSQWITSEAARRDAHRWRARSCAVMTGVGTLIEDDPRLTVRHVPAARQPVKVLVDSRLQAPPRAKIFQEGSALVFCAHENQEKIGALRERGAQVIVLPDSGGKVDLPAMMRELARREINEVLVETGTKLNGSLLRAGVVDELIFYLAPTVLGHEARGMFALPEMTALSERLELTFADVRQIGPDLRIVARVTAGS